MEKFIEDFESKNGIGKRNVKGRRLRQYCHEKELCVVKKKRNQLIVQVNVEKK